MFASLDSQFNINLLRFASIFKFFNINLFALLRNKFSNYRTSSLRFDIEKNIIIEAFDRFALLRFDIHWEFSFKSSIADSPYQWCGESATLRIIDTESQRLPVSLIRGVGDSPYHWYAESATFRIVDTGSRQLPHCLVPLKGHGNEADFQIFYLMLILSDFAADHGLINSIETKAKGCHLKKFTCKGTLRQVFIWLRPINSDKHLPQSPFTGQFFRWQHFTICFGVYIVSCKLFQVAKMAKFK